MDMNWRSPSLIWVLFCVFVWCNCTTIKPVQSTPGQHIQALKDGFLLVRIRSSSQKIQALRRMGHRTEANRLRNQQKYTNANIVKAFRTNFDFCPVYYFYAEHSKQIRAGQLDSLVLEYDLLPVAKEKIQQKPFLVAEFAAIQPPSNGAGLPGLIVLDQTLKQLEEPFPYYVRTGILGEENAEMQAVELLNEKIRGFAEEVLSK